MQKLSYQNILGETVAFYHAPFVFCKARGLGMSDMDVSAKAGAYQQGESVTSLRREGRNVKLTLHLMACDRVELYQLRSQLLGILSPDKAFDGVNRGRLIYENEYGRRWTWAIPESGLDWGDRKQNVHPLLTLNFRCESPFWYGIAGHEVSFRARENGMTLPMSFPFKLGSKVFSLTARNNGQADAPVIVQIDGKGENPELWNDTTGAVVKLIAPLPSGDRLTVNTDPAALSAVILRADGSEENGFGLLDPAASVAGFTLKPGDNALRYVPNGSASESVIRVSWYDRYEGV